MSHGVGLDLPAMPLPTKGALGRVARLLALVNRGVVLLSMLGILAAALILTSSVVLRYFLKIPTDWQDEAAVFLLVGVTFLCGAQVQAVRGHVGIQALSGLLPAKLERLRGILADIAAGGFCAFFTWKSWTLFHEAWVDGQTTDSAWAPPLSIPYGLMSMGMTLLTVQIALQVAQACSGREVLR